jgi:hypothetical protein
VSRMGFFSSDRCINEYAETIWNIEPLNPEDTGRSGLGKGELYKDRLENGKLGFTGLFFDEDYARGLRAENSGDFFLV